MSSEGSRTPARDAIVRLSFDRGVVRDHRARAHRLCRIVLALRDDRTIALLPGRNPRELQSIEAALVRTLAVAAA